MISQNLAILAGLPGSGKSPLAEGLSRHFSLPLFSVDPVEAPRAAWRNLATKYRADLTIIECICMDEATHRRRIEGMTEITWAEVEKRRTGYEAWTDARLTLDTSAQPPERLLVEAIECLA